MSRFRRNTSGSKLSIREFVTVGGLVLLALLLAQPGAARAPLFLVTDEPDPRPTPPVEAYIQVNPNQAVGQQPVPVVVQGFYWDPAATTITLALDDPGQVFAGPAEVLEADGAYARFSLAGVIPAEWASPGEHTVIAIDDRGNSASATITLIEPTPTVTPSPTPTDTPTGTPSPTLSPTPKTPTPTNTSTPTPTPSPTLAPITPMMTVTPEPVPTRKPTKVVTRAPTATRTPSPIPGTATNTPTPSTTPTVTDTPGPGTPSVTPEPTTSPTLTPTPVKEISDTGAGWGPIFLWGFVLAGLVVVFRLLRVKNLPGAG